MPRKIFLCNQTNRRKKISQKSLFSVSVGVQKNVQYFRGTPRHQRDYVYELCSKGNSLAQPTPSSSTSYIPENIFWINILCNMRRSGKKTVLKEKKIVQFLYFSLRYVAICIFFYEKEVVLRAYVYSSGFHKPEKITGAHTLMESGRRRNACDCNFLITMKSFIRRIAFCNRDMET